MDLVGEVLLFGHEMQEPINVHLLHRLQRGTLELPGHVISLRVGVDSEFDRIVGFGCFCFLIIHNGCQFGGFHPHLTTHVI